jgi:hypothetical protein
VESNDEIRALIEKKKEEGMSAKEKRELKKRGKEMSKNKKDNTFWDKTWNKRKLEKPQKVAVLYLRRNNSAQGIEVDTQKGFFEIESKTYHVDRDCMYRFGKDKLPLAVIQEDGLVPTGNADFFQRLKDVNAFERKSAEYQDLVLKAIRHAELVREQGRNGPGVNPKVVIAIVIVAIIAFAIFRSYSG